MLIPLKQRKKEKVYGLHNQMISNTTMIVKIINTEVLYQFKNYNEYQFLLIILSKLINFVYNKF